MRYMSQPLSLRLPRTTIERLGTHARRHRIPPRTLDQRYVEEGLRLDDHPLVRFADGPAGRHARLLGTRLAVWQVIEVVRDSGGDLAAAADYLELPLGLAQAAVTYWKIAALRAPRTASTGCVMVAACSGPNAHSTRAGCSW